MSGHPASDAPNPCPSSDLPPLSPMLPNGANPISGHSPAPRLQPRPAAPLPPASAPAVHDDAFYDRVVQALLPIPGALDALHAVLKPAPEAQPHAA